MAEPSMLNQILEAAKKLPGQTVGAPADIANLLMGLAAGKGTKGFVDKPIGGSESINEKFGLGKSTGTGEDIASMLMSLATPGGMAKGALAGVMVPANLLKDFKTFNQAKKALAAGEDAEKVYGSTGVFKLPKDDVLRAVIPDDVAKLKESPILQRVNALYSPNGPSQVINTSVTATKKLEDILDHPELFKAMPELKDIKVTGEFGGFNSGSYNEATDTIKLGATRTNKDLLSILLHETQHAIQSKAGMTPGTNPGAFIQNKDAIKDAAKKIQDLKQISDARMKINPHKGEVNINKALGNESKALEKVEADSMQSYAHAQGEAESRLVQKQFKERDYKTYPPNLLKSDDAELNLPVALDKLTDPRVEPFVDNNPIVQHILKIYKDQ